MSFFTNKVSEIQKENSNYYRGSGYGLVVETAKVLKDTIKDNPFFLSITGRSPDDIVRLDSVATGYSVVIPDYGGSRQTRTIINPKNATNIPGNSTGKASYDPSMDNYMELNFNNHISPSVVSNYTLTPGSAVNPNHETSTQTIDTPSGVPTGIPGNLKGDITNSGVKDGEILPFNPGAPTGQVEGTKYNSTGLAGTDIDSKGNKTVTKATGRGPYQNSIRTGIGLMPPISISDFFNV